jgi:hypothetical protein
MGTQRRDRMKRVEKRGQKRREDVEEGKNTYANAQRH